MDDTPHAPAHRYGRATLRARARELAQDFLDYAHQQHRAAAANNVEIPPVESYRLTDEEAKTVLDYAERAFGTSPHLKPGNHAPRMKLTTSDCRDARRNRRAALAPEPLPPGVEELRYAPIIRNMLAKGPMTRRTIIDSLHISEATADEVLAYMLRTSQAAVIGHRKKNGNQITVYGLPADTMPLYPLEEGDVEGQVARFLLRERSAKFSEITAAIPQHGDTAVMTALHSLMAGKLVTRVGKANQTTYIWNGI